VPSPVRDGEQLRVFYPASSVRDARWYGLNEVADIRNIIYNTKGVITI